MHFSSLISTHTFFAAFLSKIRFYLRDRVCCDWGIDFPLRSVYYVQSIIIPLANRIARERSGETFHSSRFIAIFIPLYAYPKNVNESRLFPPFLSFTLNHSLPSFST